MASNAAELSQAAAETVDAVADRIQQLDVGTSDSEYVLCMLLGITPGFTNG